MATRIRPLDHLPSDRRARRCPNVRSSAMALRAGWRFRSPCALACAPFPAGESPSVISVAGAFLDGRQNVAPRYRPLPEASRFGPRDVHHG